MNLSIELCGGSIEKICCSTAASRLALILFLQTGLQIGSRRACGFGACEVNREDIVENKSYLRKGARRDADEAVLDWWVCFCRNAGRDVGAGRAGEEG